MTLPLIIALVVALAGAFTAFGWRLYRWLHHLPDHPVTRRQIDRATRLSREPLPELLVPPALTTFDHMEGP